MKLGPLTVCCVGGAERSQPQLVQLPTVRDYCFHGANHHLNETKEVELSSSSMGVMGLFIQEKS